MKYLPCSKYTKHKCPHILQAKFVLDDLKPASQRIELSNNHPGREAEQENEQDDEGQEEHEDLNEQDGQDGPMMQEGQQSDVQGKWLLQVPERTKRHSGHRILNLNNFYISPEHSILQEKMPFDTFCESALSKIKSLKSLNDAARALIMEGLQRVLSLADSQSRLT